MAIHDKYFTGSSVSRYLSPGDRAWEGAVYQSGRPVLDSELILDQEIGTEAGNLILERTIPSGWLRGPNRFDPSADYDFPPPGDPAFVVDAFRIRKRVANVAGWPVVVEYANTFSAGSNRVILDPAPIKGGAPPDVKRSDFVFLEVFLALVSESPNATGTVTVLPGLPAPLDTITIGGLPLTAVAVPPGIDQFLIGANDILTAANIMAALNNPANSFAVTVSAYIDPTAPTIVNIRANVSGAAGNLIALACAGVGMVASGPFLAGGVDTPNKPTQDTIYRHGNTQASGAINLTDDIADPVIGAETTKREIGRAHV